MASQAPNVLPMLYNDLTPLNRNVHGNFKIRSSGTLPALGTAHVLPLTTDEFMLAQRHYPIVFSVGDQPVPLALMGLHENTNAFFDAEGELREPNLYIPAYVRRYPFMLARLQQDSDELSLCFDPSSPSIGEFDEGEPLFDGDQPSDSTKAVLEFCEQFEQSGLRTTAFMNELKDLGLLMDGEVAIQPEGATQPAVYRGFQMVDEEKFRNLRGDELRKLNQSGALALIMAHLFSLSVIREIFGRQVQQGTGPNIENLMAPAPASADA